MRFGPDYLRQALERLPAASRYLAGLSGGADSSALVHALAALRPEFGDAEFLAVHVDHGIHPRSADWAGHCRAFCAALDMPFRSLRIDARPVRGSSPEARARALRYQGIARLLKPGDVFLTAHHRDDQAETLLLQLLRGAGAQGLAAMPEQAPLGAGRLVRPLLALDRDALRDYAAAHGIRWIEDPGNADTGIDRNYLRRRVMPLLHARWPAASRTIARAAAHQFALAATMERIAAGDLAMARRPDGALSVARLMTLDRHRRAWCIRRWVRDAGLPVPTDAQMARVLDDVLPARRDAAPRVQWAGAGVRRYRDGLYVSGQFPADEPLADLRWDMAAPLDFPGGRLEPVPRRGAGIRRALLGAAPVSVRFRHGGERCRPDGDRHTRPLKHLFQRWGVAPWERAWTPLVYIGDALAAVGDHCICDPFGAEADEPGVALRWRRSWQCNERGPTS